MSQLSFSSDWTEIHILGSPFLSQLKKNLCSRRRNNLCFYSPWGILSQAQLEEHCSEECPEGGLAFLITSYLPWLCPSFCEILLESLSQHFKHPTPSPSPQHYRLSPGGRNFCGFCIAPLCQHKRQMIMMMGNSE